MTDSTPVSRYNKCKEWNAVLQKLLSKVYEAEKTLDTQAPLESLQLPTALLNLLLRVGVAVFFLIWKKDWDAFCVIVRDSRLMS